MGVFLLLNLVRGLEPSTLLLKFEVTSCDPHWASSVEWGVAFSPSTCPEPAECGLIYLRIHEVFMTNINADVLQ